MNWLSGLGEKVPQVTYWIKLNLSVCFKGYLLRPIWKLNKCRFRRV